MFVVTRVLFAAIIFLLAGGTVQAEPEMTFKLSSVRSTPATTFQTQMRDARAKVREWWGATFEEAIAIEAKERQGPSMALVPAWRGERGRMLFDSKIVDDGRAATHHEMIHVYAPNANRMLAEGLAVYGHDLLGGKPAYPNFGRNLDEIAAPHASRELILKLERASTPSPLEPINENGYALAGSFIRFVIERHGMDKFRALYALTPLATMKRDSGEAGRWQQIYGEPLESIVDGWLATLKR